MKSIRPAESISPDKPVSVKYLRWHLGPILSAVHLGRSTFVIERRGKVIAKLVPVNDSLTDPLRDIIPGG